jgi:predicted phage terminase large subunit-like protein
VRDLLASLPLQQRLMALESLSEAQRVDLAYAWRELWARPKQLSPIGDWRTWLVLAGRGFGKTRLGVEWVREVAEAHPGWRIALVGRTAADVRDVIVEGESGLLSVCPPWAAPVYEPSKRRLTWPNGSMATTYSADEPDLLRGPQHHAALTDELASWKRGEDTWSNLMFGLRLGQNPQVVVTTTPRPLRLIRELRADKSTAITTGSTYENRANLARPFLEQIVTKYEGTRLGRQELEGELLEDIPGALWQRSQIDKLRVAEAPTLKRVVVAIDPAVTSGEDSDETGIVAIGKAEDGQLYVLEDATCRESPAVWARRAVELYKRLKADRIVAEVNNGGDLVEATIRTVDKHVPYTAVHASRGKRSRAEPIAALYEQGKVHHVGTFDALEDQMCMFTPDGYDGSPDHVDALVWGATELTGHAVASFAGVPEKSRPTFPRRM